MPGRVEGCVLDGQAELPSHLATRMAVPLLPETAAAHPISEPSPVLEVAGRRHVPVTQALASVPLRELGRAVDTLAARRDEVTRAPCWWASEAAGGSRPGAARSDSKGPDRDGPGRVRA